MQAPQIVSREDWLDARRALLEEEKEFTRQRDALSARRREMPVVRVDKPYEFHGPGGRMSLADLFDGCGQLVVQHFMFGPDWEEGCPSCSFWADGFNGLDVHLRHRDTAFAAVARAPLPKLAAYARRMGWTFPFVSSLGSDFNRDFGVTFTDAEAESGAAIYNYRKGAARPGELPGMSVFLKGEDGAVLHSYSCYARGLDPLNAAYQLLDLTPKGRDEDGLAWPMAWLRRRDQYEY